MLGLIEQYNRLEARPTTADHALLFWGMRVLLEVGVGVASIGIAKAADSSLGSEPLAWVAAGAAGPIVVRARIMDIGTGGSAQPIGLAAFYEPVRDWIARQIDDIGAATQSKWLTEELLPTLSKSGVPPTDVAGRISRWFEGSGRFSKLDELHEQEFIHKTLKSRQDDDIKRELLVLRAINLGAYRVLRDLRRACRD
jgi:hypothetical protein